MVHQYVPPLRLSKVEAFSGGLRQAVFSEPCHLLLQSKWEHRIRKPPPSTTYMIVARHSLAPSSTSSFELSGCRTSFLHESRRAHAMHLWHAGSDRSLRPLDRTWRMQVGRLPSLPCARFDVPIDLGIHDIDVHRAVGRSVQVGLASRVHATWVNFSLVHFRIEYRDF